MKRKALPISMLLTYVSNKHGFQCAMVQDSAGIVYITHPSFQGDLSSYYDSNGELCFSQGVNSKYCYCILLPTDVVRCLEGFPCLPIERIRSGYLVVDNKVVSVRSVSKYLTELTFSY